MHRAPGLAIAALIGAAMLTACGPQASGQGAAGTPAPGSTKASPASTAGAAVAGSGTARVACHGVPRAVPRQGVLTLTDHDSGKRLCTTAGTAVNVYLTGTATNKWTAIHVSSGVLQPHVNPALMLPLGVTGASFTAAHPGTVTITSTRHACDASPGGAACTAIVLFHVTLVVGGA